VEDNVVVDNVIADSGDSAGATFASDDIGGVHFPRSKLIFGADGLNEGDVSTANPLPTTAKSVVPGTGATNLGKAEDAAHTSGDVGVMALGVRSDTLATLAGTDGDYTPFQVDENGAVWVHDEISVVDSNNSTTSTLGIGAAFTGTGVDLLSYSSVSVIIHASHSSATDGMLFQYSSDDSNWDKTLTFTFTGGNGGRVFQLPIHARYFRFVYTNGGTAQTHFRVQTLLLHVTPQQTTHRLIDDVNPDRSVAVTKAAIIAQAAGSGDFIPVQSTAGGNLKVAIEEADTSATGLAKAEDAVHSSGDVGVMSLGVRNDVLAALVDTDGDYASLQLNDIGALWTHHAPNDIDAGNSTTTPINANITFTGTGVDVLDSAAVAVTIDASHDSAVDGMQFQFSTDNVNWDVVHSFTYTAANGGRIFQLGAHTRYFRVVYINGGTNQTHFRVQTILMHSDPITSIHRLVDDTNPDRSATIVKSVMIAQAAGTGDFVPVQATAAGNFKIAVEEFDTSLPAGTNNIGDVDVLTLPGSIQGPASPTIDSYSHVAINLTTGHYGHHGVCSIWWYFSATERQFFYARF
jgi:hypothetical protein